MNTGAYIVPMLYTSHGALHASRNIRELKQPRRQRQGKRHFKNDFQIFQTFSR